MSPLSLALSGRRDMDSITWPTLNTLTNPTDVSSGLPVSKPFIYCIQIFKAKRITKYHIQRNKNLDPSLVAKNPRAVKVQKQLAAYH